MSVEIEKVHTLENDAFLQYIYTELVKVHVALTGEPPESLLRLLEATEEQKKLSRGVEK